MTTDIHDQLTSQSTRESVWDDLRDDPLLEPTEPVQIVQSFPRKLFGTLYENLGTLILLNIMASAQIAVGLFLGLLVGGVFGSAGVALFFIVVFGGLFGAPAAAGMFHFARALYAEDEMARVSTYIQGMRTFAVQSWILLALQAVSGGLLILNLRFYASAGGLVGSVLIMLFLLLTAVWAMAGFYAWPLLVRSMGWRLLLRNACFLALAAPLSSLGFLLVLAALSGLLLITRAGVVIFLFALWAVVETAALHRLIGIFNARREALLSGTANAIEEGDAARPSA
jgi:uncharacterized membrane protein YesL